MTTQRRRCLTAVIAVLMTVAAGITRADHTTAPTNLTATVSGMSVTLTWRAGGSPPDAFIVEVGSRSGLSDIAVISLPWGSVGGVNGRITGAAPPGRYYIRVRAHEGRVTGGASNEVVADVGGSCSPPPSPTSLTATVSGATVLVRWNGAAGATGYVLEGGTASGAANLGSVTLSSSSTTFTFDAPAGRYFLRMRSIGACGTGQATPDIEVVVGAGLISGFIGEWRNADPNTPSLTRVSISAANSQLLVAMWGRCHPVDCAWGTRSVIATPTTMQFSLRWTPGFAIQDQIVTLIGPDTLHVVTSTRFTDGSGRRDFSSTDRFNRVR